MSAKTPWLVLLCAMALVVPAAAQEEPPPEAPPPEDKPAAAEPAPKKRDLDDPPLRRWGGWSIAVGAWNPTLVGADEEVATFSSNGSSQPLYQRSDPRIRQTVRTAYHLPHDRGAIVAVLDSMKHDDTTEAFTPGQFVFSETRAFPLLTGVFDDGLADGVASRGLRKTREFRLEFQNRAFDSRWVRASWGIGYRQLSHERVLDITYYAIVPNIPPILPPLNDFDSIDPASYVPIPDAVSQRSKFSGHGLGVSLDVEFPIHRRVSLVSGLSIGLVRGRSESTFSQRTSAYFLGDSTVPMTRDELFSFILTPPVDDPDDPDDVVPTIANVHQDSFVTTLNTRTDSQLSQSYDIYFGVEVRVYKGLRVFATLRDVSYSDVGKYLTPEPGPSTESTPLNAGYEGYIVGLSWRF